jgi:hypothetical protein
MLEFDRFGQSLLQQTRSSFSMSEFMCRLLIFDWSEFSDVWIWALNVGLEEALLCPTFQAIFPFSFRLPHQMFMDPCL